MSQMYFVWLIWHPEETKPSWALVPNSIIHKKYNYLFLFSSELLKNALQNLSPPQSLKTQRDLHNHFKTQMSISSTTVWENQWNSEWVCVMKCCVLQTDMLPIYLSSKDKARHTCIFSYLDTLCCFSSIVSSWLSGGLIRNRQLKLRFLLGDGSGFQPVNIHLLMSLFKPSFNKMTVLSPTLC
jgi:hypothetical protein